MTIRKGFSLGGAAPLRTYDVEPNGPVYPPSPQYLAINDYRQPTVREELLAGPAPVTWVKLWIDLHWLFEGFHQEQAGHSAAIPTTPGCT